MTGPLACLLCWGFGFPYNACPNCHAPAQGEEEEEEEEG